MGILLCEQNFRNVWIRNERVRAEIGQILHTDTHPHTHTQPRLNCSKYDNSTDVVFPSSSQHLFRVMSQQ